VTEHTRFLSRFNPHEVLAGFDGVVIDAMDALSPKCGLIAEAGEAFEVGGVHPPASRRETRRLQEAKWDAPGLKVSPQSAT
jgi:hypothetical protein